MKRGNYFLALIILSFFAFFSCDKDEIGEPEQLDCMQGEMTFNLNGTPWTATSFTNTLIFANDPQTGMDVSRCDIRATNAEGEQLICTFTNPNATDDSCMDTGSYVSFSNVTSSEDNAFLITYMNSSGGMNFMATEGTASITACNSGDQREITGTFTFEDMSGDNIGTEGQFSVCVQ